MENDCECPRFGASDTKGSTQENLLNNLADQIRQMTVSLTFLENGLHAAAQVDKRWSFFRL